MPLAILYLDLQDIYLEQACEERKRKTKEKKQAKFALNRSLRDSNLRLSDPFAKGAHPAFEITISFFPGLFRSERWEGTWRLRSPMS